MKYCLFRKVVLGQLFKKRLLVHLLRAMGSEAAAEAIPQTVIVRSVATEGSLSLTLNLRGHTHNLLRSKEESLGKTMKRISLTAAKAEKKEKQPKIKKQRLEDTNPPIEAHLYCGSKSTEVAVDTPNSLAWVEGNVLIIGDAKYTVRVNPPKVISLKVSNCIMSGYPIVPEIEAECVSSCSWVWRRHCQPTLLSSQLCGSGAEQAKERQVAAAVLQPSQAELNDFPIVGNSLVYWPSSTDCGRRLLLECIPTDTGGRVGAPVFLLTSEVSPSPSSVTPITRRHKLTPSHLTSPDRFRVVSYNILADPYASTNFARQVLYPYCYPDALDIEYRQCLVVRELLGYHADVMCLQEVGEKSYTRFLLPALQDEGYEGCFSTKAGRISEGEAIVFNTSKFSLVSSAAVPLKEFIQNDPLCSDLYKALQAAPTVLQSLLTKGTIVLSAFLRCLEKPNHFLCVANTHLYFHPMADHIRLLQVVISLRFVEASLHKFREAAGQDARVAVVFGGDFNSCPCIAAYSYMISGAVSKSHPDWMVYKMTEIPKCNCNTKPQILTEEREEQAVESNSEARQTKSETGSVWVTSDDLEQAKLSEATESDKFSGLDLKHDFHFQNACGTNQYTNYTAGYCGVLDYVFFDSDNLELEQVIPQPSHEEVIEFVALPSVYFPSDHLALVTDLKWR